MTSKNLYFNLMKEEWKRRLWVVALSAVVFFFAFPVRLALLNGDVGRLGAESVVGRVTAWFSASNWRVLVLLAFATLIAGVTSFSYLHSKQKTDFYHSLPVSRNKLFVIKYCSGILLIGLPYLISLLLGLGVSAAGGMVSLATVLLAVKTYLFFMLHFILMYSVTVLAMIMTGNTVIGILGTAVLDFFFPVLEMVIWLYYITFFSTGVSGLTSIFEWIMPYTSPVLLTFQNNNYWIADPGMTTGLAVAFLITAALTGLSFALYKRRSSEAAGRAMAFAGSRPVIRIPLVILSSLIGGIIFTNLRGGIGWAVFGLLCGLILAHCLIEIIYNFDFKKLFSHRLQMAVCAALSVCVFLIFRYDVFGYDSYIPQLEKISFASVQFESVDRWVDYGEIRKSEDGTYQWENNNPYNAVVENMRLTQHENLTALAQKAVEINKLRKQDRYSDDYETGNDFYSQVSVRYTLNSGRKVQRDYYMPLSTAISEFGDIYRSEEYKTAVFPLLTQTFENTAAVNYEEDGQTTGLNLGGAGSEEMRELLTAYQKEFAALSVTDMMEEEPIGQIQFMTVEQREAVKRNREVQDLKDAVDIESRGYYPLYPSFGETIAILERHGIRPGYALENMEVTSIEIDPYSEYWMEDEDLREYAVVSEDTWPVITDQREIAEMISVAVWGQYASMNSFSKAEQGIQIQINIAEGAESRAERYLIPADQIPEFLK